MSPKARGVTAVAPSKGVPSRFFAEIPTCRPRRSKGAPHGSCGMPSVRLLLGGLVLVGVGSRGARKTRSVCFVLVYTRYVRYTYSTRAMRSSSFGVRSNGPANARGSVCCWGGCIVSFALPGGGYISRSTYSRTLFFTCTYVATPNTRGLIGCLTSAMLVSTAACMTQAKVVANNLGACLAVKHRSPGAHLETPPGFASPARLAL